MKIRRGKEDDGDGDGDDDYGDDNDDDSDDKRYNFESLFKRDWELECYLNDDIDIDERDPGSVQDGRTSSEM